MKILEVIKLFDQPIPPGFGRQSILDQLTEKVIVAINHDIFAIIGSAVDSFNIDVGLLQTLHEKIDVLSKQPKTTKSSDLLKKNLRFLILVLRNHQTKIQLPLIGDPPIPTDVITPVLDEISKKIGAVPDLNEKVPLPEKKHLPPQYERTIEGWKGVPWINPSRGSSTERLEFFSRPYEGHQFASVRLHLIERDKNNKDKDLALNYADADFYQIGDLQADHLQPSEQIVARQLELVEAMNIDPLFGEAMLQKDQEKNTGYFVLDGNKIFGSKKFYMEYHNCVDNLWFLNPASNSGTGKSNEDPITWLARHERFGDAFFGSIGGREFIKKEGIFYTTENGELLATAACKWFREYYKQEIFTGSYVRLHITQPLEERAADVSKKPDSSGRKRKTEAMMIDMAIAQRVSEADQSDPDSDSSVSSEGGEVNEENMEVVTAVSKEEDKTFADIRKRVRKGFRDQRRKKRSRLDAPDNPDTAPSQGH